jgi:hypothetical protein
MNRTVAFLALIVIAFAVFIGVQAGKQYNRRNTTATPAATDTMLALTTEEGELVRVRRSTLPPPPPKDYAAIAQVIADAHGISYLSEILEARGGHIARWIDRRDNPVTVWIQKSPGVKDFWPDYPNLARNAFYTWSNAGIPIRFLFIDDSATAEVRVRWVEHFNDAAAGKTYWARDVNWWILGADIELALHSQSGQAYDREAVHAIALHEVGHLIGLDHASDNANIMARRVQTLKLSSADLKTAHLIYKLPPGSTRAP